MPQAPLNQKKILELIDDDNIEQIGATLENAEQQKQPWPGKPEGWYLEHYIIEVICEDTEEEPQPLSNAYRLLEHKAWKNLTFPGRDPEQGWDIRHYFIHQVTCCETNRAIAFYQEDVEHQQLLQLSWPGKGEGWTMKHYFIIQELNTAKLRDLCDDLSKLVAQEDWGALPWPGKKDGSTIMHKILLNLKTAGKFNMLITLMGEPQWAKLPSPKKPENTMAYELAAWFLQNGCNELAQALQEATRDEDIAGLIKEHSMLEAEPDQSTKHTKRKQTMDDGGGADVFTQRQRQQPKTTKKPKGDLRLRRTDTIKFSQ